MLAHPKSQMGSRCQKELDEALLRLKLLPSNSTDIINLILIKWYFLVSKIHENMSHTVACKQKFIYEISKAFDFGPWKADEDRLLLNEAMDKITYWKNIMHSKLRRTLLHCIRRYKAICKEKNKVAIKRQLAYVVAGIDTRQSLPRTATPTSAKYYLHSVLIMSKL